MHQRQNRPVPKHDQWLAVMKAFARLERAMNRKFDKVIDALEKHHPAPKNTLGAYVNTIYGKRCDMAVNVPVGKLKDTEQIELSTMPRKADGHVDIAANVMWVSSDPSQVGITPGRIVEVDGVRSINADPFTFHDPAFDEDVECPGAFNAVATTPLTSGTATVTASATGYESADFGPISYEAGVPRSLNASVGSPVSDL